MISHKDQRVRLWSSVVIISPLPLFAGSGLPSTWQCSDRVDTRSGGRDEVPDDPHALARDAAVPDRTRESAGTLPAHQYGQGLYEPQCCYTSSLQRFDAAKTCSSYNFSHKVLKHTQLYSKSSQILHCCFALAGCCSVFLTASSSLSSTTFFNSKKQIVGKTLTHSL